MAKAKKTISLEKMLGGLTKEQAREFAAAYNGGLGSGKSPEEWKREQAQKEAARKKKE